MPALSRKRSSHHLEDKSAYDAESPEPATQRRRISNPGSEDEAALDNSGIDSNDADRNEMVKNLVRLALACEYARKPIRRQDITEKVLGSGNRQFKHIFTEAQNQLRLAFGMEMVELPAKEKVTIKQRRTAQNSGTQNKTATNWILRSTLPVIFREHAAGVMLPSASPTLVEESKYTGICGFIVSLLILYGGSLSGAKLGRYLRRVGLEDRTPVQGCEDSEKLLKRMDRDGYIFCVKENSGGGDDEIDWHVGPRGRVEVGEEGARGLVLAVYGDLPEHAKGDLGAQLEKSLALNNRPTLPAQASLEDPKNKRKGSSK